jgi:hypothetical protein
MQTMTRTWREEMKEKNLSLIPSPEPEEIYIDSIITTISMRGGIGDTKCLLHSLGTESCCVKQKWDYHSRTVGSVWKTVAQRPDKSRATSRCRATSPRPLVTTTSTALVVGGAHGNINM